MPSQRKSFSPNGRVTPRPKKKSKILEKSRKEFWRTQANMRRLIGNKSNRKVNFGSLPDKQFPSKPNAKLVNNSVPNGGSMSNHVPASKGMKQPTASRISVEKQKSVSRLTVEGKATHSRPTHLKAMSGLAPKTTDSLGQYSDSSSRLKKRASPDKDTACAKYSTAKLEFSIHKASCTNEGNDRHDEIVIDNDKENVKFGETKAKHTLVSTLSDIHCNSGSISSYQFGSDLPKFESVSKKRKEPLSVENPKALNDDSNVGVQLDNMSCKQMNRLKQSRVTRDGGSDLIHVCVEDGTASILKNDHAEVSTSSCVKQQCYSCSKPIDKPAWSGIFKTDDKQYISLDGHLSTKSCEKAWSLSTQLHQMVEVKKLLRLEVWPKAWEVSKLTADDIGIYFFPHEMRQDKGLDQIVREVMQNDLALQAIIGEAEMLIFPSILLPNHHQTFQGKHYLWGVFKRREDKGDVVEEPLNVVGRCEMEKQQNVAFDQPNHLLLGEEPNQEMIQMVSVIPLERHMLPAQEVEASHLKGPTNKGFDLKALGEEGGLAEATLVATNAAAFPASHGQVNPSMGHTPGRLMGFVVRKTPKLDQIIREIEQEGALVFAMQGEMVGGGPWTGSNATSTQK